MLIFWRIIKLCRGIKNDLDVAAIRLTRRWKAHDFVFPFLNFFSKFRYFWNLNGIIKKSTKTPQNYFGFWSLPFWFQKGSKIQNSVDAINSYLKYGPSAFQNRSNHHSATFRTDFKHFWISMKIEIFAKKSWFLLIFWKIIKLCRGLKNDLDVAAIRLTRRWKAHDFVFPFLNFLSKFRSFCNLNGILKLWSKFPWIFHIDRYGSKKASKTRNLLMQSIFS